MNDTIPNVYHCPQCGKFLSQVHAQIESIEPGPYIPKVDWNPYGTCKKHGELVIKSHWEENWGCMCNLANDWDTWDWGDLDL